MSIQGSNKKLFLIFSPLILILIYIVSLYFLKTLKNSQNDLAVKKIVGSEDAECQIVEKKFKVRGLSLSGVLEPGTVVDALLNYYQCHQAERGDVVLYKMNSQTNPTIKIVKGIPGDSIGFQGDGKIWNILVNDKILTTSQGEPYQIDKNAVDTLTVYMVGHQGVIPPKAHLLMGNIVSGSVDSTRFGLVDISDIIGKIVSN